MIIPMSVYGSITFSYSRMCVRFLIETNYSAIVKCLCVAYDSSYSKNSHNYDPVMSSIKDIYKNYTHTQNKNHIKIILKNV